MLEKLFSSKTRVEVLKLFLFNPESRFYQRNISVLTAQPIRGVQREVAKLESVGLIEKWVEGNRVYYKANRNCPIFEDLKKIFLKTVGIAEVLGRPLAGKSGVDVAFVYGSYARGEESSLSDIDLFVIGNVSSKQLSALLSRARSELGREINCVLFTERELRQRVSKRDHFVREVLRSGKVFIVGSENELKAILRSK